MQQNYSILSIFICSNRKVIKISIKITLYFWIFVHYERFKRESIFQKSFFLYWLVAAWLKAVWAGCLYRFNLDLFNCCHLVCLQRKYTFSWSYYKCKASLEAGWKTQTNETETKSQLNDLMCDRVVLLSPHNQVTHKIYKSKFTFLESWQENRTFLKMVLKMLTNDTKTSF